jgi:hypothetical protein
VSIPSARAGAEQAWAHTSLPKTVTLEGDAVSDLPIRQWKWTMLYVPPGSVAATGVNGNFSNGVSTSQNPSFVCDVDGCYVLQLEARNEEGWSIPLSDKELCQTAIYILTDKLGIRLPGAFLWRYDGDLNQSLLDLEAAIGTSSVDSTALHKAVAGELAAMTEKNPSIGNDLLLLEDSAAGYAKKKIKVSSLTGIVDTTALHKVTEGEINAMTAKASPVAADLVVIEDSAASWAKKKVTVGNLPQRWSTYKQDTEYSHAGITFDPKFTFRVVRDSNKAPTSWRIVVSMRATNSYGGRAEVRVRATGSGGTDLVTITSLTGNTERVYSGVITINPTNEPQDEVITVEVALRIDTSGDTAYMKFFEFFSIAGG